MVAGLERNAGGGDVSKGSTHVQRRTHGSRAGSTDSDRNARQPANRVKECKAIREFDSAVGGIDVKLAVLGVQALDFFHVVLELGLDFLALLEQRRGVKRDVDDLGKAVEQFGRAGGLHGVDGLDEQVGGREIERGGFRNEDAGDALRGAFADEFHALFFERLGDFFGAGDSVNLPIRSRRGDAGRKPSCPWRT